LHDHADLSFEFIGESAHLRLARGDGAGIARLRLQANTLDGVLPEDLECPRHRSDLVGGIASGNFGFGITGREVRTVAECRDALRTRSTDRPTLIAARVDPSAYDLG